MPRFLILLALWFTLPATIPLWAQSHSVFDTPAPYAVIMDAETGAVLYEKNARVATAPASMTKIMTAALVFDRIRDGSISPQTEFTVSEEAWRRGGAASGSSTMFLELGSQASVENLLKGVIIQSGNDACIVLAEGIAGSETAFANMMTARAKELGLKTANFENSTGWPHEDHVISAYELAELARYVITEYPEFYSLYAQSQFSWNGITQSNRNPLLGSFTGADGLKTGYTEASQYGLVGSAKRGDQRIIMVVNGLESNAQRRSESIRLIQAGFESFKVYELFESGDMLEDKANVFMGKSEQVSLMTDQTIRAAMHRSLRDGLNVTISYDGPVPAPIVKGDQIAHLHVQLGDGREESYPLFAAEDVERKSMFARALHSFKLKFGG